jgi:hypothetical protein
VLNLASAGAAAFAATDAGPAPVASLGAGEGPLACALPAGLSVRRLCWHPWSPSHLLVLLSDGRLRLYAVPSATQAAPAPARLQCEQELSLCDGAADWEAPVDFAPLPAGRGCWDALSVLLLYRDGALRALCPAFAPFGAFLGAAHAEALAAEALEMGPAGAEALAWLRLALPQPQSGAASRDSRGTPHGAGLRPAAAASASLRRVHPHLYSAGAAPALQTLLPG